MGWIKHSRLVAVLALLGAAVGIGSCSFNLGPEHHDVIFQLNGAEVCSVALHSEYEEKGVVATYDGVDVSNKVSTVYYASDKKTQVEKITTDEVATFYVDYTLKYETLDQSLWRTVSVTDSAPLSIHFLELGNKYTGDSVYIKAGDTDILIDAGSRNASSDTIAAYLNQEGRVEDNKLEYVVATHAHQDHISGFVGTKAAPGIFDRYECGTIIDFAGHNTDSKVYNSYITERDAEVAAGAKHYTALECWNSSKEGAQRSYTVAPGITMDILYQRYYEETSSDENNYSVCLLFTQGENHYLFTGDLEEGGEASLVEKNNLPEVILFKGGHHGSYTANTDALLRVIKPKNVCICCCAGSDEYTSNPLRMFPAQDAIDRIGKYTEKVYVTTLATDDDAGYTSMNGNITCTSAKGMGTTDFVIHGSNNDTILKDTDWFKANRTWPQA